MEKEHQPDSMATVTMKPDYPPSEIYSTSEPPPAYRQPKSTAVQIAKIAALTVILSSVVLGSFLLAASYVQARASCQQMEQLDAMLDRELALEARQMHTEALLQDEPLPLNAQALQQDVPVALDKKSKIDALQSQDNSNNEEKLQSIDEKPEQSSQDESPDSSDTSDSADSSDSSDSSESNSAEVGREPIRITLPLQLDFDELAGALIEKNQRSRMNCVVEKRRAEELVDHQPRNIKLPFGLNLTTDPRLERVTGERMAIFCESGDDNDRQIPDGAEILGGFPVPLPGPMRMPLHFPIPPPQFHQRPPMPAQHMQAPAPQSPPQFQQMPFQPQHQRSFPPQFVGQQFPPQFIPHQFPHQQRFQPQEQRFQPEQRFPQEQPRFMPEQHRFQQEPQRFQPESQRFQPEPQRFQPEPQRFQPEPQQNVQSEPQLFRAEQTNFRPQQPNFPPQLQHVLQMALIPREVRIHVQRVQLPQVEQEQVPQDTHVTQEESAEQMPPQQPNMPLISVAELRAVEQAVRAAEEEQAAQHRVEEHDTEEPQSSNHEMLGRQAMARAIPVNIPVPMMLHQAEEVPSEESQRPHYVQPRSVRSVDSLLRREKRVKRCACDCAC